jgi:hypothetical protein
MMRLGWISMTRSLNVGGGFLERSLGSNGRFHEFMSNGQCGKKYDCFEAFIISS